MGAACITGSFVSLCLKANMKPKAFAASARFARLLCVTSACTMLAAMPVCAQDMVLPGSVDPGRALENQERKPVPDRSLETEVRPKAAVPLTPAGAENLKFVLKHVWYEGMTAYEPQELQALYNEHLGKEISVATLFDIMAKVQQKYLDDGYALTKVVIPNQNIQGGEVRLAVIEGHVSEVEIAPDIRPSPVIDDAIKRIKDMHPLNVRTLERLMLILNDLPDLDVSAVLATPKAQEEAGGVRLVLQKSPSADQRGIVALDDHGSVFSGPVQMRATGNIFHVGPAYSKASVTLFSAMPIDEQKSGSLSYSTPVFGASGAMATLSSSLTHTEPGSSLSILDIKGVSQSNEVNISYPLIRQRDMTLNIDGGFEWKNARTKILGEELYDDRLRILKTGLNLNFTDAWAGYNVADIHYSQGLDILGVRESGSEYLSRLDGKSDFHKFEMLVGRIQALPNNFELYGVVNGQYALDPLLSSEEFGFGGGQIGRGYDPSEITGDHGVAASFEVRYNTEVPIFKTSVLAQPYIFYDIGKIWNIDNGADDKISAASTGFGVRATLNQGWNMDLNLAIPMTRSADQEPKYQTDVGGRVLFSLSKSF
ncbi:MAG: hypothetical protein DI551_09790 [Micavibrio aeruginosavorus]|uniref:ShlB/FhaC/HecB family hemolysin secretion/activation protein n=1 Tax=Micavibrio aeruginosavorus TaxID=349221 RepID=A0A2W5MTN1_9BACT|nr:MAG: hypothetical protein DI551_09790 [Micavibrio aeruginosavorus]